MSKDRPPFTSPADVFAQLAQMPAMLATMAGMAPAGDSGAKPADPAHWLGVAQRLQAMWLDFQREAAGTPAAARIDPGAWAGLMQPWLKAVPMIDPASQRRMWDDSVQLWQAVLGQYGIGPQAAAAAGAGTGDQRPDLPRKDRRFADPRWRDQPLFALVHQTYLLLAEQIVAMADAGEGTDRARSEQLRFAARTLVDALSPGNFPLTNPVVIERTLATGGENLVKGMAHLLADLRRGQLTHTDPEAFRLGQNIATTPGKVVYQTPLFQLIQYSPTTERVRAVPLVIFPPWINRFYILDLSPEKSFIRWAVDQGLTVFVVSWKSADASLADTTWDDYIAAQIEAIDTVRARLKVKSVHTIGYCVAGTTLAATLAVLARRGDAAKVKSATFFTAQVDFAKAGELQVFIDDQQIEAFDRLSAPTGYLDGRYMAATFNLLRGNDLIWNYVIKNYLLGEDYPAFDLLHWNGDVTNLPAKWHGAYLRDLYRDNRLVQPGSLSAGGTPIDLTAITTPCYIQAGREDHIAPAPSVWQLTRHLAGPWTFVLAGSGHIAGVVNPPAAKKYQYWTNPAAAETLDEFIEGAAEIPGSWWPHWIEWIGRQDRAAMVPARGRRIPGSDGDPVIEDAPGSYVMTR